MEYNNHPTEPKSNVMKVGAYDPKNYVIANVPLTVSTHEELRPNIPPCLTQYCVGKYLVPVTKELDEVPIRPSVRELPEKVINGLMHKDKAFWVSKPGVDDHYLHDLFRKSGMKTVNIKPTPQAIFPRSYQYELECVQYRRRRMCNKEDKHIKILPEACYVDCSKPQSAVSRKQKELSSDPDSGQVRWRNYPNYTATLSADEIQNDMMHQFGAPFKNEACNWYNKNYPPKKYNVILRKFAK